MDSETSKVRRPTTAKTKAVTVPRIPQDIVDEILDHLATDSDFRSLQACALVSKPWVQSCRRRLFHTVLITFGLMKNWFRAFPVLEESPACHVKDLHICIGGCDRAPEKFFEYYTPWFTGVQAMCFYVSRNPLPLLVPSLWKLPQSVTSLTIDTDVVTLVEVRDIIAQLPNLDDLSLSGFPIPVKRGELVGIGTILRGRFGGKLILRGGCANWDVANMLLESPPGLRFTEMRICCSCNPLPMAVSLMEASGKTLIKLSYVVTLHYADEALERSFDLSQSQNLQEVMFSFVLAYVPTCRNLGRDLQRIADEVARIDREFEGAVNFTVVPDSKFEVVLDTFNVFRDIHHPTVPTVVPSFNV